MAANTDLVIRLRGEVAQFKTALASAQKDIAGLKAAIKGAEVQAKKSAVGMATSFAKAGKAIQAISAKTAAVMRSTMGSVVTMLGTAGFVGSGIHAVKVASKFQYALAEVSTLLKGDALKAMDEYREAIRKLATTSDQTHEELSKGLYQIISAGVRGTETAAGSMEMLDTASRAAAAGITDTFTAVDVLTTTLNSYNVTTAKSQEFSDMMFTTVRLGKTTFNELAHSMGVVSSIAAGANISFGELNAAVVALTKNGLQTDMAITGLRQVIIKLLTGTPQLNKAFKEATGHTAGWLLQNKGLVETMKVMNQITGGNTQKIAKLGFEARSLAAASTLANTGMENFVEASKEMQKSAGATDEAFKKVEQTFSYQAKVFKNQFGDLMITVGEQLQPMIAKTMADISSWMKANSKQITAFFEDVLRYVIKFLKYVVEYGPRVAEILLSIWAVGKVQAFGSAVIAAGAALSGVTAATYANLPATQALKMAWLGLKKAILGNPLLVMAGAIWAIVEAVKALIEHWDELAATLKHDLGGGRQIAIIEEKLMRSMRQLSPEAQEEFLSRLEKGASGILGARVSDDVKAMAGRLRTRTELEALAAAPVGPAQAPTPGAAGTEQGFLAGMASGAGGGARSLVFPEADEGDDAKRKAAQALLYQIRLRSETAIGKLRMQMEKEIAKIRKSALPAAQKEEAIAKSREYFEKKIADVREKAQDEYLKKEAEGGELRKKADEVAENALKDYFKMRDEEIERGIQLEEEARARQLAHLQEWKQKGVDALRGIAATLTGEIDNLFGAIYRKAYQQIRELVSKGIEAAAEGSKQIVLTADERAKIERDIGRPLTNAEARSRGTAMTQAEIQAAQTAGRLGDYDVVGTETPQNRMREILDVMKSWWENLAENLAPILTWLTETAVPELINAIVRNAPKIIDALNESWVNTLPMIADLIADNLMKVFDEIPEIVMSLIDGIVGLVERLLERLPDIMAAIFSSMTDMTTTLVQVMIKLITEAIPSITTQMIAQMPAIVAELIKELVINLFPEMFKGIAQAIKNAVKGGFGAKRALKKGWKNFKKVFHKGGMIDSIRAHNGLFVDPGLAADEVPIIAQTGEAVLSRKGVAAVGGEAGVAAINQGSPTGGINVHIEHMMSEDTERVVDRLMGRLLRVREGNVASAIGGVPGLAPRRG